MGWGLYKKVKRFIACRTSIDGVKECGTWGEEIIPDECKKLSYIWPMYFYEATGLKCNVMGATVMSLQTDIGFCLVPLTCVYSFITAITL